MSSTSSTADVESSIIDMEEGAPAHSATTTSTEDEAPPDRRPSDASETDSGSDPCYAGPPTIAPADDEITLITAECAWDTSIRVNDAMLVDDDEDDGGGGGGGGCDDDDGGGGVEATPILPWWKQRGGQVLIGIALAIFAVFVVEIIVLNSREANSNKNDGDSTASIDEVPAGKGGGTRGRTCPSDESANDCGATLEIWTDVVGWKVMNLVVATDNFTLPPNRTERLIDTLSGPYNFADNYGIRIHGWLVPPITSDEYFLMVSGDDEGELWLSTDDDPVNRVMVASFTISYATLGFQWEEHPEQRSSQHSLIAGRSYYFEVRVIRYEGSCIVGRVCSVHACMSSCAVCHTHHVFY
jgi:hypothetical protein